MVLDILNYNMSNNFDNTFSGRNTGDLDQDTYGQNQGTVLGQTQQGLGQQGQGIGSNTLDNSYGQGQTQGQGLGQAQGQGLGSSTLDNSSYGQSQTTGQGLGSSTLDDNSYSTGRGGAGNIVDNSTSGGYNDSTTSGATGYNDSSSGYNTRSSAAAGNDNYGSTGAGTDDYARNPSTGEKIKGTLKEMTGKLTNNPAKVQEGEAIKRGEL